MTTELIEANTEKILNVLKSWNLGELQDNGERRYYSEIKDSTLKEIVDEIFTALESNEGKKPEGETVDEAKVLYDELRATGHRPESDYSLGYLAQYAVSYAAQKTAQLQRELALKDTRIRELEEQNEKLLASARDSILRLEAYVKAIKNTEESQKRREDMDNLLIDIEYLKRFTGIPKAPESETK